MKHTRC